MFIPCLKVLKAFHPSRECGCSPLVRPVTTIFFVYIRTPVSLSLTQQLQPSDFPTVPLFSQWSTKSSPPPLPSRFYSRGLPMLRNRNPPQLVIHSTHLRPPPCAPYPSPDSITVMVRWPPSHAPMGSTVSRRNSRRSATFLPSHSLAVLSTSFGTLLIAAHAGAFLTQRRTCQSK